MTCAQKIPPLTLDPGIFFLTCRAKFLVSIHPDGYINFVSRAYPGKISDDEITKESGFLDMLKGGMGVMADKG
jgi:hypothetical protein